MKKYKAFYRKKIHFLEVKFPIYLNRRVFVMSNFGTDMIISSNVRTLRVYTVLYIIYNMY